MSMARKKQGSLFIILFILAFGGLLISGYIWEVDRIQAVYGKPGRDLGIIEKISLNSRLLLAGDYLLSPGGELRTGLFEVSEGESAGSIAERLEQNGWIRDAQSFLVFLQYSGIDRELLPGMYSLKAGDNGIQLAHELHAGKGRLVRFVILPGWRNEEIAFALEGYDLGFSQEDFIHAVKDPGPFSGIAGVSPSTKSLEGRLFPGSYYLSRQITLDEFTRDLLLAFSNALTPQMELAYRNNGLTLDQAIVLASIVEKETVLDVEAPLIASVFFNRLAAGMRLESDPTVQYAVGYDNTAGSWWKNPLSYEDLRFNSVYNTYIVAGLPPTAICNPGEVSLQAVAKPAITNYYYFRAACDGSGKHEFSYTYEEHLSKGCP